MTDCAALFDGFFLGGFECSRHRLEDGHRVDLLASTRHEALASGDYARLRDVGVTACREGVSWVDVEAVPGQFDFSRVASRLEAARAHRVEVIWDLMRFAWPDDVDLFSTEFPARFRRYARAFARWYRDSTDQRAFIAPIDDISTLAWAGGEVRAMNPFELGRGVELKAQLVRATLEAIAAIRALLPSARFVQPEPLVRVVADPRQPRTWQRAQNDELSQYQTWDMLSGRVWPSLGGSPEALDLLGLGYHPDSQYTLDGTPVVRGDPRYQPFSTMLLEVAARYGRSVLVTETGAEGAGRPAWLAYVADQCAQALRQGCPLHGVTLYPAVDHPGWMGDGLGENGLWSPPDAEGHRAPCGPVLQELKRQTPRLIAERAQMLARQADAGAAMASAS